MQGSVLELLSTTAPASTVGASQGQRSRHQSLQPFLEGRCWALLGPLPGPEQPHAPPEWRLSHGTGRSSHAQRLAGERGDRHLWGSCGTGPSGTVPDRSRGARCRRQRRGSKSGTGHPRGAQATSLRLLCQKQQRAAAGWEARWEPRPLLVPRGPRGQLSRTNPRTPSHRHAAPAGVRTGGRAGHRGPVQAPVAPAVPHRAGPAPACRGTGRAGGGRGAGPALRRLHRRHRARALPPSEPHRGWAPRGAPGAPQRSPGGTG